jgi:putative ABC transport system substrate-binding protein
MSNQLGGDLSGKMFELLKEVLPQLSKVAIVWNPDNLRSAISFREGEAPAAQALGVTLVSLESAARKTLTAS